MSKLSNVSEKELGTLCEQLGVYVTKTQVKSLLSLNALLGKWNTRYNLIATSTLENSVSRHLLDALSISRFLLVSHDVEKNTGAFTDVLDIGSGAGFPVLPLAIARPDLTFVSVETNGKKTRFQKQACIELGIHNVDVRHTRIENVTLSATNVTSRAFRAPIDFLQLAEAYCSNDGQAIVMLGQATRLPQELPTPWQLQTLQPIDLPNEQAARHVAVCQIQKL